MRIAVLTLCRDRLEYTKRCFQALRENAGIPFDHYVLDQGSTDGTAEWLEEQAWQSTWEEAYKCPLYFWLGGANVGIHRGMNFLLDQVAKETWIDEGLSRMDAYDLLVKVDNDCLLLTPGTLKAVAEHILEAPEEPRVVSPLILGLRNRPGVYGTKETAQGRLGLTRALGGILMPLPPAFVKAGFRYDETGPLWGGDDERICMMVQEHGGELGYLLEYEAEHVETTEGQVARYPEYFARRVTEGGPPK